MAHDVFISYSAKDKATGDAVCAMLESEGVRCWIAPRDVLPSMEWGEAIIDAIEECRIMVLIFTANANASPQIRREVERAVNHGVAILPLRMEDVLPGKALEYFIGNVHWLDALTPPLEAHLKNLAGTIKIVLGRMEPRATQPARQTAAGETPQVAEPPELAAVPPAEPDTASPAPHPAESVPQETQPTDPGAAPETVLESMESQSTRRLRRRPRQPRRSPEPAETLTAEIGPLPSGPQEAPSEDSMEVSAPPPGKVQIVWTLITLGVLAALIALAVFFMGNP